MVGERESAQNYAKNTNQENFNKNQDVWDEIILLANFAYNSKIHDFIRFTHLFLVHG